jgi:L-threonylcarbamoyladenylate synthase
VARVVLVDSPSALAPEPSAAYIGIDPPAAHAILEIVMVCKDVAAYAHELFAFFRRCDAAGVRRIYCQTVEPAGMGRALMDRLKRAAEEF